jgi:hypothetical protein
MTKFFGSDCTKGALEWQFRRYRAGAKLQAAAVSVGQDPKNVNVDVNPQGKPDGKSPSGANCTFTPFPLQHSISHHKFLADRLILTCLQLSPAMLMMAEHHFLWSTSSAPSRKKQRI